MRAGVFVCAVNVHACWKGNLAQHGSKHLETLDGQHGIEFLDKIKEMYKINQVKINEQKNIKKKWIPKTNQQSH